MSPKQLHRKRTAKPETLADVEEQSQKDHLEELIKEFERVQTVQDVGAWLIDNLPDPLPPKHIDVLKTWLETHNNLTIKQNRRGNPHSDLRNAFIYITRMHRDTGMSISAACELVVERLEIDSNPTHVRRAYDRAMTAETRLLNDTLKIAGAFATTETPHADTLKSGLRYKSTKAKQLKSKKP